MVVSVAQAAAPLRLLPRRVSFLSDAPARVSRRMPPPAV